MKIQHLLAWISLLKFQSTSLEHTLLLSVHIATYSYMWIILVWNSQEYAIIHPFWTISWNSPMLKKISVSISKPNLLKTVSVWSQRNITNWMHTEREIKRGIIRNWLRWLWKPRSPKTCSQQAGNAGKPKV